jgi:hypothetical protein
MPITEPTEWRWPDSTFGPQKQVPFNDDLQYPNCGSQRIYTLENILYGLEKVITPLLESVAGGANIRETSATYVMDATPTAIGTAETKKVVIWLLSTADANAVISLNSGTDVILEKGYSMEITTDNLNRIEASQPGAEGDTLYIKYL